MNITQVLNDERQRLLQKLEELAQQKKVIDVQIAQLQTELNAIAAYESAKEGKKIVLKNTSSPQTNTRQSGIRRSVLDVISSATNGIKRRELIDRFDAKGDKAKMQSITNAVANLKRNNAITLENGIYKVKSA